MNKDEVSVTVPEILRVFRMLEEVNDLFHQPMKYKDSRTMQTFADKHYQEIKDLYYDIVWKWLPINVQREITG